jgi:predicted nucleotidyltransferase
MSHSQNIVRIRAVHDALGELSQQVIFVGGATVSLYADRPSVESRPTEDVDILIELLNYSSYAELDEVLRKKGFHNDIESGIICRYKVQGIVVDVMPTSGDVLGFTNRWYQEGFSNAMQRNIGDECIIRIFQPPYFIASKLEAFKGRGSGDGRFSSDFEDIIYVLNNRGTIWEEMYTCSSALKKYLKETFKNISANHYLYEWVSAHLDYAEQRRTNYILGGIEDFVNS